MSSTSESSSIKLTRMPFDRPNPPYEEDSLQVPAISGREHMAYKHRTPSGGPLDPLVTCRLGNSQPTVSEYDHSHLNKKLEHPIVTSTSSRPSGIDIFLAKLSPRPRFDDNQVPAEGIVAGTAEPPTVLDMPRSHVTDNLPVAGTHAALDHSSSSSPFTPATESLTVPNSGEPDSQPDDVSELLRLKQELLVAKSKIAIQEQELTQTRVIRHTLDQALGTPSEADFSGQDFSEPSISRAQPAFNPSKRTINQFQDSWISQDAAQSATSDAFSLGTHSKPRSFWPPFTQDEQFFGSKNNDSSTSKVWSDSVSYPDSSIGQDSSKLWVDTSATNEYPGHGSFQSQRSLSGIFSSPPYLDAQIIGEQARYPPAPGMPASFGLRRPASQPHRGGSYYSGQHSSWGSFYTSSSPLSIGKTPAGRQYGNYAHPGFHQSTPYRPQHIGTQLSPTASEFTSASSGMSTWGTIPAEGSLNQPHISLYEPLNYRFLLEKNVNCDWKYIVDKIVRSNDQQASLFLQQKLKVGTTEQKYEVIEAITNQAYPLMVNRFGNFLIQRCFEHGTREQVIGFAEAIRGNVLSLSMDPFGCHVVQKALDCVPEEQKAFIVHELLRRIPETVVHRYACHVWQKLFELRWSGESPQIMSKVNEALRGMWHEVALGETGSLVVQNIFENCVEDDKRPAIEEVLGKIDVLARGQFGNWCIQHICEHGAPHDKNRAIEHILLWAVDYSMDQFASKIVEKCLKIGGSEFLDRYLARVCIGLVDRPRMPLVDIAGDQYGNYLIQWILVNAAPRQRDLVATHIRKHMVSLRGSKFGSRVAMLCCNEAHVTRPGPGASVQITRFNGFNDDRFHGPSHGRFSRSSQWNPHNQSFH